MPDIEGIEQLLQEFNNSLNTVSLSRIFWAMVVVFVGYWLARFMRYWISRRLHRFELSEQMVGQGFPVLIN